MVHYKQIHPRSTHTGLNGLANYTILRLLHLSDHLPKLLQIDSDQFDLLLIGRLRGTYAKPTAVRAPVIGQIQPVILVIQTVILLIQSQFHAVCFNFGGAKRPRALRCWHYSFRLADAGSNPGVSKEG